MAYACIVIKSNLPLHTKWNPTYLRMEFTDKRDIQNGLSFVRSSDKMKAFEHQI